MKFLIIFFLFFNLYAYEKSTDANNVYFSSEHFKVIAGISYSDSDVVLGIANLLLDSAEDSWSKIVDEYEFREPYSGNRNFIDIYIGNYGAVGVDGVSTSIPSIYGGYTTTYPSDNSSYFVMNPNISSISMKVTIAHEFFHTIQYAYFNERNIENDKMIKNIWWLEATAVLMEDEVYNSINDYISFLYPFFRDSYQNIEIYNGSHEYSMVIFAKFIKEKFGIEIIKETFGMIENSGVNGYFEILDMLLKRDFSTSMELELNKFALWVSNPSEYFEEGNLYPQLIRFRYSDNKAISKGGILCLSDEINNIIFSNNYYYQSYSDNNELLISNKNNFDVKLGLTQIFEFDDLSGYFESINIKSEDAIGL